MFAVAFEDGRAECHMWGRPWAAPGADELPRMRQLLRLSETATGWKACVPRGLAKIL